jgi:hypothetical protein
VRAEHSPRLTHGNLRNGEPIWMAKARAAGTLRHDPKAQERVRRSQASLDRTLNAWGHIHNALATSPDAVDRALAQEVQSFLAGTPMVRHMAGRALEQRQQHEPARQSQEPKQGRRLMLSIGHVAGKADAGQDVGPTTERPQGMAGTGAHCAA